MKKIKITEEQVKIVLDRILNEDTSRISRQDFNRIQYKIEELQNSLNDTIREFKKLDESIPIGLKTMTSKKLNIVSSYVYGSKKTLSDLSTKISQLKKSVFNRQIEEKK